MVLNELWRLIDDPTTFLQQVPISSTLPLIDHVTPARFYELRNVALYFASVISRFPHDILQMYETQKGTERNVGGECFDKIG